ncbi:hypothetical protein BKA65DRAFT_200872 [Rhexocercosporidium sp. MPI-PUGE-AT-0058]|nr:hypothetical protein BKA65DRAFT_200872 [Rhexocercosporidium sp. MPI-PUGE-AT-0058]
MDSTTATRRFWTRDETVALFAWLDFCIMNKLDFKETIIEHLSDLKPENGFSKSLEQVLQKLVDVQRHDNEKISRKEMLLRGSRCWEAMPDEFRSDIGTALQRYAEGNFQAKYAGTRTRPCETTLVASSSDSLEKCQLWPTQEVEHAPLDKLPKVNEAQTQQKAQNQPKGSLVRRVQIFAKLTPTREEKLQATLIQKDTEITTLRKMWHQEVDSLRVTISKSTQTELSLRAEIQHLVIARQERERAGKDPLEYELFQLNQTIWSLNRRVYEMQRLAVFAQTDCEKRDGIEMRVIDEAMNKIESELQLLMHGRNVNMRVVMTKIEESGDLGALLKSMFEDNSGAKDRMAELNGMLAKFGSGVLVRTFALAALREWVFATAFPDFAPRNVRLLEAYRHIIITHDGWSRLHNLELAAYDSLIEDNNFRDVLVPGRAKQLASRLLCALAPLVSSGGDNLGVESWGDSPDVCGERRFRLTEIFEAALHLKASMVRADQSCEFVIYGPGISSNEGGLALDRHGGDRQECGHNGDDHWLAASIHLYQGNPSYPRDALKDALLQCRNFVKKEIEDRVKSSIYTKSIALPKSEEPTTRDDSSSEDEESRKSDDDSDGPAIPRVRSVPFVQKDHPVGSLTKYLKCPICSRGFSYQRSLQQHHKKSKLSSFNRQTRTLTDKNRFVLSLFSV